MMRAQLGSLRPVNHGSVSCISRPEDNLSLVRDLDEVVGIDYATMAVSPLAIYMSDVYKCTSFIATKVP